MSEKVAIVGSRKWPVHMVDAAYAAVRAYVRGLPAGTTIISGEAIGVDSWAKMAADEAGLPYVPFPPRYDLYDEAAPLIRNMEIAAACDRLVAFQYLNSGGTGHVVGATRSLGKRADVFNEKDIIRTTSSLDLM